MGSFQVNVRVANLSSPQRFFEEKFWVDTGAIYSSVPEDKLDAIGLAAFGARKYLLADGRRGQLRIGAGLFEIEGISEQVPCPVIFAPPGSPCLLGATALENFGLDVDPTAMKLKPTTSIMAGSVAC